MTRWVLVGIAVVTILGGAYVASSSRSQPADRSEIGFDWFIPDESEPRAHPSRCVPLQYAPGYRPDHIILQQPDGTEVRLPVC